jgi:hypothetical protein
VRLVVQKNKKLELAQWYGFPVYQLSVLTLLRMSFEKSDQSETPVHRQKSAHPMWLKARSRAGFWSLYN